MTTTGACWPFSPTSIPDRCPRRRAGRPARGRRPPRAGGLGGGGGGGEAPPPPPVGNPGPARDRADVGRRGLRGRPALGQEYRPAGPASEQQPEQPAGAATPVQAAA